MQHVTLLTAQLVSQLQANWAKSGVARRLRRLRCGGVTGGNHVMEKHIQACTPSQQAHATIQPSRLFRMDMTNAQPTQPTSTNSIHATSRHQHYLFETSITPPVHLSIPPTHRCSAHNLWFYFAAESSSCVQVVFYLQVVPVDGSWVFSYFWLCCEFAFLDSARHLFLCVCITRNNE